MACKHGENEGCSLDLYGTYHLHKTLGITSTVACQTLWRTGVPAMCAVRGGWVNHDGASGLAHGREVALTIVFLR